MYAAAAADAAAAAATTPAIVSPTHASRNAIQSPHRRQVNRTLLGRIASARCTASATNLIWSFMPLTVTLISYYYY